MKSIGAYFPRSYQNLETIAYLVFAQMNELLNKLDFIILC